MDTGVMKVGTDFPNADIGTEPEAIRDYGRGVTTPGSTTGSLTITSSAPIPTASRVPPSPDSPGPLRARQPVPRTARAVLASGRGDDPARVRHQRARLAAAVGAGGQAGCGG